MEGDPSMFPKIALLFPGQGAQFPGMGKDLKDASSAAAAVFAAADEVLGRSLTEVMWNGPEDLLTRTGNCQPALFVHGLAALAALREALGARAAEFDAACVGAAGLSLGEATAHAAAGTFDFANGLRLVQRRGDLMEEACNAAGGSMVALIGGSAEAAAKLAEECGVQVANYNTPAQFVLSGVVEGIQKAADQSKAAGFRRATVLKVAGAYHSRLMAPAQERLAEALTATPMVDPRFPVAANFDAGLVRDPALARTRLAEQVTGSVRWVECVQRLSGECGAQLFLEFGPGATLAGMVPRIVEGAEVLSVNDAASVAKAAERLLA